MPQHNPPPMGLSKLDKGYKVCVWAPHAASVSIHGEFDDWSDDGLALSKEDGGVWAANVPELKKQSAIPISYYYRIWRRIKAQRS